MKIATRLRGAFAMYIALLAAVVVYQVRTIERTVASGHALNDISSRVRVAATEQVARATQINSDVEKFYVTADRRYLTKVLDSGASYGRQLARFDSLAITPAERLALAPLENDWRRVAGGLPRLADVVGSDSPAATSARDTVTRAEDALERIRLETERLGGAAQEAMSRELGASETIAGNAVHVSWIAALGAIALSILLSALLVRSIIGPVERLAEGTREVSAGRFSHRLDASGGDELAQVARDFNSMAERLDELDRMKRDFVARVSHDLKTPLSSMQETISVLLDGVAGPVSPKQKHLLELNLESGRRLAAMLTKLLDLSRIEGGLEADMEMLDLLLLVRRSTDRAGATQSERGFRVSLVEPAHRVIVRGDAAGLAQVVDNLVENAIKFSPAGGSIVVRVTDEPSNDEHIPPEHAAAVRRRGLRGSTVAISVSDEGPGIPAEEKERVFDRFYQTEAGRAARGRGVGLGLTICREIVTAHGGAIWVSDNEPHGSVFHVLLPGAVRTPLARAAGTTAVAVGAMMILSTTSCAPPVFERYVSQERWSDAAHAFAADSSLLNDEHALFEAGTLYGSPKRGEYDPARARELLQRLLIRFPSTRYRVEAADRLALIDSMTQARDASAARARDVEAQIAQLAADRQRMRAALDSANARGDSLQRATSRIEADLRDRDEQLRALRMELVRLKEIDLKPRPPAHPPQRQ
ncbi:MAG TPA: HAMP domain-containing sensor histidine kinase [Gemmatimonadaceae bacterium]|jgi:signal transduction histidine kinase|nr:HAMP domain-containing sensor histidine kinase [Gemmatimonadaceae bacterium]